jgi:hypothetical protein
MVKRTTIRQQSYGEPQATARSHPKLGIREHANPSRARKEVIQNVNRA